VVLLAVTLAVTSGQLAVMLAVMSGQLAVMLVVTSRQLAVMLAVTSGQLVVLFAHLAVWAAVCRDLAVGTASALPGAGAGRLAGHPRGGLSFTLARPPAASTYAPGARSRSASLGWERAFCWWIRAAVLGG
jgi:hypothetical protein